MFDVLSVWDPCAEGRYIPMLLLLLWEPPMQSLALWRVQVRVSGFVATSSVIREKNLVCTDSRWGANERTVVLSFCRAWQLPNVTFGNCDTVYYRLRGDLLGCRLT